MAAKRKSKRTDVVRARVDWEMDCQDCWDSIGEWFRRYGLPEPQDEGLYPAFALQPCPHGNGSEHAPSPVHRKGR